MGIGLLSPTLSSNLEARELRLKRDNFHAWWRTKFMKTSVQTNRRSLVKMGMSLLSPALSSNLEERGLGSRRHSFIIGGERSS
jgi:hypothetical protein